MEKSAGDLVDLLLCLSLSTVLCGTLYHLYDVFSFGNKFSETYLEIKMVHGICVSQ